MALKPDREVYITDLKFTFDVAAAAGQIAILQTQPSGHAVGQGINALAPVATLQGTGAPGTGAIPVGVLLCDVENIYSSALLADGSPASGIADDIKDPILVRTHRNYQKVTQVIGENVPLLKDGVIWTNCINGTPSAQDAAYLGNNSNFQNNQVNSQLKLGKFETSKDSNGYALIVVKMV